jgi:hypothetical protein
MANLNTKIKLYAAANSVSNIDFYSDVILRDDMVDGISNPYIKEWNLDIAQPTAEQIASYETAGNAAETLQGVLSTRRAEYPELKEQLDLLYKDMAADKGDKTGEWFKAVKKVKDDNPKE